MRKWDEVWEEVVIRHCVDLFNKLLSCVFGLLFALMTIKDVIFRGKAKVILLQETKLGFMYRGTHQEVCPYAFFDGFCLPLEGAFGGIWVVWDSVKVWVTEH